jgi:hypothetical protein
MLRKLGYTYSNAILRRSVSSPSQPIPTLSAPSSALATSPILSIQLFKIMKSSCLCGTKTDRGYNGGRRWSSSSVYILRTVSISISSSTIGDS